MDRIVVTQVVAMIVVLSALARWLPDDDPGDPLGLGVPHETLLLDAELQALGPDSDDALTLLRIIQRPPGDQVAYRTQWMNTLRQLREIQANHDPSTLVQFRGVPRNDMWALMYLLYPQPFTFTPWEEGSRDDDEAIPGAATITTTVMHWSDMTPEQLRARQKPGSRVQGALGGSDAEGGGR